MDFEEYLKSIKKSFGKTFKAEASNLELNTVDKELPPTGLVLDNPLLEYAFDRRFIAYGRCYLLYGKKGCSKTSLLFDFAKLFQKHGGKMFWIETENAPDFRYMELQGVDPKGVIYHNPKSLEEALTLCKITIESYSKYSDGKTPIMIALDSIAGASTEYERDQDVIGQTKVGEHAKLMSAFYRNIIPYLECENMIFVATNQLKENIGAMSFGAEKPEALIGGEAQRFNSTYQFKVARTKDILLEDHAGVPRKAGSSHSLTVKRNKLGREGNSQKIDIDLFINGGMDYYTPLIKKLSEEYTEIVQRKGAWYSWVGPEVGYYQDTTGNGDLVKIGNSTGQSLSCTDMAKFIFDNPDAKEVIRQAFGIPDMPKNEIIAEIEKSNKTKRKRITELETETEKNLGQHD